eukprot:366097-Chlamydomonas_euryale.AAC.51
MTVQPHSPQSTRLSTEQGTACLARIRSTNKPALPPHPQSMHLRSGQRLPCEEDETNLRKKRIALAAKLVLEAAALAFAALALEWPIIVLLVAVQVGRQHCGSYTHAVASGASHPTYPFCPLYSCPLPRSALLSSLFGQQSRAPSFTNA